MPLKCGQLVLCAHSFTIYVPCTVTTRHKDMGATAQLAHATSPWQLLENTPVNGTGNDYLVGFGNDPFGAKMMEHSHVTLSGKEGKRRKRSVAHLYNMVSCATGCDPLSYKGYGCYCGFLGSGFVVDGIDRCCQMHDWCYDSSGCPMFLEYFVPYLWKCYHNRPLCAIELGSRGSCGQRLCQCDQLLAQCLRRYPCPSTKAICTSSPWRLFQNIFML